MKIVVIGASGVVGSAVAAELAGRGHEVVAASRRGPVAVDVADAASVEALFRTVTDVDAVVCCAANAPTADLVTASDTEFTAGLSGKLLGQVRLARTALHHLNRNGSITLTGGTFTEPLPGGSFGALVNAGLAAFVEAAAPELPRSLRLNLVAPGWVRESLAAFGWDPTNGTPAADVARVYADLVEGDAQGAVVPVTTAAGR
ncbi:short chain dehydrogenase [Jiangella mangrovi]|uniref:NAD(P)-dependent dehydrogenase (Short-subunit alcohol dehydrogenase family) n=1 Tax=Jiangella mangrovi TaxID=1524084 RepID=A0A7W9GPE9_9ACTN|nr:NAD(P)-dependent dehydrogenase (short-subunit alcohol dehydrogenase family) [Jiangella mangrovi]